MKRTPCRLVPLHVFAALGCGWVSLLFARHSLVLDHIYDTRLVWPLFFPMLISIAWEPVYAYITGIGGLVFLFPFIEAANRGWGNLLIGLLYLLLMLLCGHLCNRPRAYGNYYLLHILYAAVYCLVMTQLYPLVLSHNQVSQVRFTSPVIVRVQAITFAFGILALAAFIKVLLSLPGFRRVLQIAPLPYSSQNEAIFLVALLVVAGFFVIDGIFEAFYFESRGLHTSILSSNFGQIIKLPIVFAVGCMICDAIICSTMKNLESRDKLLKSEERYRMIFQHTADAYFEIDSVGTILNVNPAIHQNLYFIPESVLGKNIRALFHEQQAIDALLTRLFACGQVNNIEINGLLDNWVNCSLLFSGNVMQLGEQQLAVLTARNISDYKKAEERRWELSALLNAIFESNRDFIWTVDCHTFSLISFNQAFSHYIWDTFGREIHAGSRTSEIFSESDSALFTQCYQQVLKDGDFSIEYRAEQGGLILDIHFYPVKLHGETASIAVFTKNVTAQKRAERKIVELNEGLEQTVEERTQELRTAYRDLESFSYTVTHEFRTPIREIGAYLEIIQEDNYDALTEQSKADILCARRVCEQTLDMIQKMMIYAKAGFMVLNIERINMNQLVRDCFHDIQQATESKALELILYDLPPLYADAFLMRAVVMNIMSNSIKFAQTRDKIILTVGYMSNGTQVHYYFKDNGVGFESSHSNNLFDLFHRAHNNSEYEGSGIGLALVKRILHRHGGRVEILGEVDRGCVIVLSLQREPA